MKRSIKVVSTVFVMLILSTFSVFGTYFLTEHDAFESIMSNARATRCQGVVLRDQGYYNEAYSHISMECMLNSTTASTSVIVSGSTPSSRKKCYAETYVIIQAALYRRANKLPVECSQVLHQQALM